MGSNADARVEHPREPIAIIGIGCRFPGNANNPAAFWTLLQAGVDAITEIPADRWNIAAHYHPEPGTPGKTYSRWGGFLHSIDQFEPEGFGISPREAAYMDPQQRLLLEVAWEALEDGGQVVEQLAGTRTGVFVGISTSDYAHIQSSPFERGPVDAHVATGGALSIAAGRISYCLNLQGPSLAVDTACSSSLVATHLACQSLWNHESDLVLAGGVNIIIAPDTFIGFCAASMLSPDGRCKAFDSSANGFVRGEGAGMVLLKPLSKALADGDPVYAVILASAVNQDGRTAGIAMPSRSAQAALLREVYQQAGIAPHQVHYIETHGTGTAVGDPIEAQALGMVLAAGRSAAQAGVIGSVKTNIGHLEAAAGIAGLIKTALVLKHRMIPPNLHFHTPNPSIPFDDLHLRVPTALEPWPEAATPAVASVNSFGFGGTNAHVVLREYRPEPAAQTDTAQADAPVARLLPLSARTPAALQALAQSYRDFLRQNDTIALADLCYTASVRRTHFEHRVSLVASSRDMCIEHLEAMVNGERRSGMFRGRRVHGRTPKLVGVFAGQGPQWWGMGRELLHTEPVFRQAIEACDALLQQHADWSLLAELTADEARSRLQETAIAQPAIFALQVALTALWQSWGVTFDAVVGHSVGEIAAAHAAGALRLEEAVRVIYHRARCMDLASSQGKMLAVGLSMPEARQTIQGYGDAIALAAVNSPTSATLSGDPAALRELAQSLEAQGIYCQFLRVNYAFHSAQMDPVHDELLASLRGLAPHVPDIPMVSTVTGEPVDGQVLDAHYWWQNVRQTVCFAPAVDRLIDRGYDVFVEVSPHPVLSGAVAQCLAHRGLPGTVLPSLRRQEEERATMLASLGGLYTLGYPVDWQRSWPAGGRCVQLPTYPWQRQSYWHESAGLREERLGSGGHPLLGRARTSADPSWEVTLDPRVLQYLADHRVHRQVVFPASAYVEMARAVAQQHLDTGLCILEDVQFHKALFLPENGTPPTMQTVCYPADASFAVHSRTTPADPAWTLHATGSIRPMSERSAAPRIDLAALERTLPEEVSAETCYTMLADMGLHFGPAFRGIERLWRTDGVALGQIRLREHLVPESGRYGFHPAFLDSCLQVLSGALPPRHDAGGLRLYLPVQIERIRFYRQAPHQVWSHALLTQVNAKAIVGDIHVYDADGTLVLDLTGFRCQAVEWTSGAATDTLEHWLYEVTWRHKPRPEQPLLPRSAADLPGPRALVAAVTPEIQQLDAVHGWSTLPSKTSAPLDRLATVYILQALGELGWQPNVGDRLTVPALLAQLPVGPQHQRLLRRFMQILARVGYLSSCGTDTWEVQRVPPRQDANALWRQTLRQHPAFLAELNLLATCGAQLAAILRGDTDPLQGLFPNGSTTTAEHFFQDAPSSLPYVVMVQKIVQQLLRRLPRHRPLRILEIGGGTGGLTSYVLPQLPAHCTDYVFSDISQFFLTKAEQKFHDAAFVRFQLLDIEHDPLQQGYAPHTFDLIMAFDVLHATCDLRTTLGHVEQLLASEGLLVLVENEHPTIWIDMVFGISEGWWRFTDTDLRPDYPLLTRDAWQTLLEALRWTEVTPLALPREPGDPAQVVLLARGPSVPDTTPSSASVVAPPRPEGTPGSWLIFADQSGIAAQIASRLRSRGDTCWIVTTGDGFQRLDSEQFQVSPSQPEDLVRLLQTVTTPGNPPWRGMMHLWSLDVPPPEATTTQSLQQAEALGCHCVMHFAQALYTLEGLADKPLVVLVTRGAQPLGETPVAIGQASLVGLGRTMIHEYPDWRCKLLDLDPDPSPQEIDHLLAELWTADTDEEIVYRHGTRFVPRLEPARPVTTSVSYTPAASVTTTPYRVEPPTSGVLTNVVLRTAPPHHPGPGQVEIAVAAAALNFRDVMKALGLFPTEGNEASFLGDECAGTVVAVGEGVDHVQVGDEVMALAPGSFGSHVTTAAPLVVPKPVHLTFAEAVTIPTVFLTAYYALHRLAHIRAGECLLIHAAAGGVGLAAVQIAQHAGAEIFATAGSPEKRAFLTRLGAEHVMDSRSLAFFDQIMERTNGNGVDIVLNSLAGQALTKSIACLAPHGRFLELGKRDIYQNSKVGLWPFRKNIAFFAIDLGPVIVEKPTLCQTMLDELCQNINTHTLHPLPHRVFPVRRLAEALRYMAQGRHIGKVVVTMQDHHVPVQAAPASPAEPVIFPPDATYLITGGLGGFGLVLAQWIIERGGRHLVLMGRSGAASADAQRAVEALRATGAQVDIAIADVTSAPQVAEVLTHIDRSMPRLRGVFHAAMGIDDDLLVRLDQQRFRRATAAKVEGAWNLHTQTLQQPLDHFVLFSSFASLVGNPGQANYTAANTFLDALAAYRRSLGLPGTAMNWGQLTEVGYVARHQEVADYFKRVGVTGFAPQQAMAALERLLRQQPVQMGVLRIDWHRWAQLISRGKLAQRLSLLIGTRDGDAHGEENRHWREALLRAAPEERQGLIHTYVQEQVARILGTAATSLDDDRPLDELGLDSLMAIELKNRLESDLAVELPMRDLMQRPTLTRLSSTVLRQLDGSAAGTADRAMPAEAPRGAMSPASTCLVPLQPRGVRPPLFCLHPVGGQVNIYRPLVDLLPADQPVYGLQSRLLAGAAEEHQSIEEMADAYARLMRHQQPQGPYSLLGFSFGGFLAMAVANVLERQGQRVAFVGLVDCHPQWTTAAYPQRRALQTMIVSMYDLLQRELEGLPELTTEALSGLAATILASATEQRTDVTLQWLSERHAIGDDMPLTLVRDYLAGFFTRFESHIKLIPHFQAAMVRAPLRVWWAQEELSPRHDSEHHWHRYTSAAVEETIVPGSHYAVMYEPSVATLAPQLVQRLHAIQTIHTTAPHNAQA